MRSRWKREREREEDEDDGDEDDEGEGDPREECGWLVLVAGPVDVFGDVLSGGRRPCRRQRAATGR